MRRFATILLVVVLVMPLGTLALAAVLALRIAAQATAGDERPHAWWPPTHRVLFWSRLWCLYYRVPGLLHLAVLHQEASARPRAPKAEELDRVRAALGSDVVELYPIGDLNLEGSFGAGQVRARNIERFRDGGRDPDRDRLEDETPPAPWWIRLLMHAPVEAYALVGNEWRAMWASVRTLRECLDKTAGDEHAAAARYNGFGAVAAEYRAGVEHFITTAQA